MRVLISFVIAACIKAAQIDTLNVGYLSNGQYEMQNAFVKYFFSHLSESGQVSRTTTESGAKSRLVIISQSFENVADL